MNAQPRHLWIAAVVLLLSLTAGYMAAAPTTWAQNNNGTSPVCQALNDPSLDARYAFGVVPPPLPGGAPPAPMEIYAGEVITIRATGTIPADAQAALVVISPLLGFSVQTQAAPATFTYTAAMDAPALVVWSNTAGGTTEWTVSCNGKAGCDTQMPISPDAAVGRFVQATPLYWAPGQTTDAAVNAGQTAWVLGVDASGAYYQIIWACDVLWVPVETMGPNSGDPVWQGVPLPTGVVQ